MYTVRYKIDRDTVHTIEIQKTALIQDLIDAVSEKHNRMFKTIYLRSYLAFLDLDDMVSDWPPDEEDSIFYFSEDDDLRPDNFEN